MALTFPNETRSYDEERRRIRFVGYDGMLRIEFGLEIDALARDGAPQTESSSFAAFDSARANIRHAAEKAYRKQRQSLIVLTSADFDGAGDA
jgi:hypothetical protein